MDKQKLFYQHFFLEDQERRLYATWCKKKGITFEQLQILYLLWNKQDGEEIGIVADMLSIPRQTMTNMLDTMEKKGWILRNRAVDDRRKIHIAVTSLGSDTCKILIDNLWGYEEKVMQTITPQEFAIFNDVYHRIVHGLAKAFSEEEEK